MKFVKRGKVILRYIGPFEILQTVREVAYDIALTPEFLYVQPIFHVSMSNVVYQMSSMCFGRTQFSWITAF